MHLNYSRFAYHTFLGFALALCGAGCMPEKPHTNNLQSHLRSSTKEKRELWLNMANEAELWVDGMGKGLDEGIKNTVIALNLLGFKTSQSCEGHIDWGLPYPWVDFQITSDQAKVFDKKLLNIYQKIEAKMADLQKKYPELHMRDIIDKDDAESKQLRDLYTKMHAITPRLDQAAKSALLPLYKLLEKFYKNKSAHYDLVIHIHEESHAKLFRIYSLGGSWQTTRNEPERTVKLKKYQQEMNDFTNYLIDYFFHV